MHLPNNLTVDQNSVTVSHLQLWMWQLPFKAMLTTLQYLFALPRPPRSCQNRLYFIILLGYPQTAVRWTDPMVIREQSQLELQDKQVCLEVQRPERLEKKNLSLRSRPVGWKGEGPIAMDRMVA